MPSLGEGQSETGISSPGLGSGKDEGLGAQRRRGLFLGSRGRFEQSELGPGWRSIFPPLPTHVLLDPPPSVCSHQVLQVGPQLLITFRSPWSLGSCSGPIFSEKMSLAQSSTFPPSSQTVKSLSGLVNGQLGDGLSHKFSPINCVP